MDPRPGTVLDARYRLLRKLGEGGRGVVFEALHLEMGRRVAVKLLLPGLTDDATALERFRREGRAAARLDHPFAVVVHDFRVSPSDGAYLVMELCDGGSLAEELSRDGRATPTRTAEVLEAVAAAVAAAHRAGIVHRDLKPANILFAGGRVKVADFGMALLCGDDAAPGLTGGFVVGSPHYMSPEQVEGKSVGPASDQYSLGVVVYEMLAGRPPFEADTARGVMVRHLSAAPVPLDALDRSLPADVSRAVLRALAKDVEDRFPSVTDFADALSRAIRLAPSAAPPADTRPVAVPAIATAAAEAPERLEPVGREKELARMNARLLDALRGRGGIVLVPGGPGAGKTTLAEAFVERERRARPELLLAVGRCSEQFGAGEAYQPFLEIASRLTTGPDGSRAARLLAEVAPTWQRHLPGAARSTVVTKGPPPERSLPAVERMPRELTDFVAALSAERPLLLVFEDVHWADRSSVDLVTALARRIRELRLLLVVTYRPSELEVARHPFKQALRSLCAISTTTEVVPRAFGPAEVGALLARELGGPADPALSLVVTRRTDGNPLFVVHFARHLVETRSVVVSDGTYRAARPAEELAEAVPQGVTDLIRDEVERLDEPDLKLLQLASVAGAAFDAGALAAVLPADELEVEERLERLERRHRLLASTGETEQADGSVSAAYRFAHAFYQNALYAGIPPRRRALWHAGLAAFLERRYAQARDEVAAALAVHWERARDVPRALAALVAAAEAAAQRNPREAAPFYSRAAALASRLPTGEAEPAKARLLVRLGRHQSETAELSGDPNLYDASESAVREALTLDPDGEAAPDARTTLGLVHLERGENERSLAELTAVTSRWPGHAPAHAALAYLFKNTGLWERSQEAQARAGALDPALASSIPHLSTLIYQGRLDEALEESAALVRRRPRHGHFTYWKGIVHYYRGELDLARVAIEAGHALDPHNPIARGVLGFLRAVEGRTSEARALLSSAESGAAADGTFTYWLAKGAARLTEPERALEFLDRAERLGYWNAPWVARDPAIEPLRSHPGFAPRLERLAARQRAFAALVDARGAASPG